jgi:hypothetical protein
MGDSSGQVSSQQSGGEQNYSSADNQSGGPRQVTSGNAMLHPPPPQGPFPPFFDGANYEGPSQQDAMQQWLPPDTLVYWEHTSGGHVVRGLLGSSSQNGHVTEAHDLQSGARVTSAGVTEGTEVRVIWVSPNEDFDHDASGALSERGKNEVRQALEGIRTVRWQASGVGAVHSHAPAGTPAGALAGTPVEGGEQFHVDRTPLVLSKEWPGGSWHWQVLGHGHEESETEAAMADLQANGFLQYVRVGVEIELHFTATIVLVPEGPHRNEHAGLFDSWGMDHGGHPQTASFWGRLAEHLLGEHSQDIFSYHLRSQTPWEHRWEVTHSLSDGLGVRYTISLYFQNGAHATATINIITVTTETGRNVFTQTMNHIHDSQTFQRTQAANTLDGPSLEIEVESPEITLREGAWDPVPGWIRIRDVNSNVAAKIKFRPNYIGILRKVVQAVGEGMLREVGQVILGDLIPTAAAGAAADSTGVSIAAFVGVDGAVALGGIIVTVASVVLAFRDMDSGTAAVRHANTLLNQCTNRAYDGARGLQGPTENQQDLMWQAWNYGLQLLNQASDAEHANHPSLTPDQAYEQIRTAIARPANEGEVKGRCRRGMEQGVGMIGFIAFYRQCHTRTYWSNMATDYMRTYFGPDWGGTAALQNMWDYFMHNGNDPQGLYGPR